MAILVEENGGPVQSPPDSASSIDNKLNDLIKVLQSALEDFKNPDTNKQLRAALHDHNKLPDKETARLASQAIDHLHEIEQTLEPGSLVLADLFLGYMDSKCLVAAVELNIPDVLQHRPLPLDELATQTKARPDRLRQIMRVLYNRGIFSFEPDTGLYSNTSTSELLLLDHWTQWRNWVDLYGNEWYDMAIGIPDQIRQGETRMAGQIRFKTDKSLFQYFIDQGQLHRVQQTLSGGAIAQAPGILADYPWDEISDQTFLDIGGGQGGLVASILREYPGMKAGLLDTAPVIERAKTSFHTPKGIYEDVGSRVPSELLIVGDFLKGIPPYEIYTMKWCLHDWNDSDTATILQNIRDSIIRGPRSRLIIFESLLADGRSSRLTRYADITMMISANGQERDEKEWRKLAEQTGWKLNRIYQLRNAWPSAIEFTPNWNTASASLTPNGNSLHSTSTPSINGCEPRGQGFKLNTVTSEVSFLEPWDPSKGQPFYRSAAEDGLPTINFSWSPHSIFVADARPIRDHFTIEHNGFEYLTDPAGEISAELLTDLRKNDKTLTARVYYDRVSDLIKQRTGCSRVLIFDDTVRRRQPELSKDENPDGREQPATTVHCDQSARGARRRLAQNLPGGEAEADELLQPPQEQGQGGGKRVQLINVWRPINGPVVDWPLATMDYASLLPEHSHDVDLWRGRFEDRGQTMTFEFDEGQRWYYLGGHGTDEVTLIKIFDSWGTANSEVVAKCCPHVAFKHPETPQYATPRESIEVRCFAIYDT